MTDILSLQSVYIGISVIIALVLHELGHAFVSYKLGDPTPKREGRLTLNPLKHLDPLGTLCLFIGGFGWAKPVCIDYRYYKDKKFGVALVSLAGPLVNFVLVVLGLFLLNFNVLVEFLVIFISINAGLCVFNLIPIPPLDGSKILAGIIPRKYYDKYMMLERYGFYLLLIVIMTGVLNPIIIGMRSILIDLAFTISSILAIPFFGL